MAAALSITLSDPRSQRVHACGWRCEPDIRLVRGPAGACLRAPPPRVSDASATRSRAVRLVPDRSLVRLLGLEVVAIRRYRARKAEAVVAVEQSASIDEVGAEKADE